MRNGRSNERNHRFSFTQALAFIIVGTRVYCALDDPPRIEGSIEAGYVRLNLPRGHRIPTVILKTLLRLDRELSYSRVKETQLIYRPQMVSLAQFR